MNINDAYPSKYLKASDLQGRNATVKIGRVDQEAINGEKKLILYFQGKEKGMVLNKTNANNVAAIYGGETEDWYGKAIVLVEAMVDYQGQSVPAIRIRAPRRDEAPPSRQAAPQRQMAEAGFADERSEPRRAVGGVSDNMDRAPVRSAAMDDMNDDIPF